MKFAVIQTTIGMIFFPVWHTDDCVCVCVNVCMICELLSSYLLTPLLVRVSNQTYKNNKQRASLRKRLASIQSSTQPICLHKL